MNFLGHNEFGLNYKSWNLPIKYIDPFSLNYWLEQWSLYYKRMYKSYQSYKNCFFITYEELSNPKYVKKLFEKVKLNNDEKINLNYFKNSKYSIRYKTK